MKKKTFFEKLTGGVHLDDEYEEEIDGDEEDNRKNSSASLKVKEPMGDWAIDEPHEGQLTADVYQTPTHIVIKTLVAGVKREDVDISISRDTITIKGKRQNDPNIADDDYFHRELYWGAFSRTIMLPHEIDIEGAEASENLGMLTIKLPRVDKGRQTKLRVMKAL